MKDCIKLFNKCIITKYTHRIYGINTFFTENRRNFKLVQITERNITQLDDFGYNSQNALRLLRKSSKIEGFYILNMNDELLASSFFVYRGGEEFHYKCIKSDAFLFNFAVYPKQRGKKLSKHVLLFLISYMFEKGKKDLKLAVKDNNLIAIHLYESIGFKFINNKRFYRIFRLEKKKII